MQVLAAGSRLLKQYTLIMSQLPYRANLSAAIFPMTLARAGRSVIIPGPDQNFNRSIDSPDDSNRDAGIPQIIYGENILPTADGYQSVGYTDGGDFGTTGAPDVQWVPIKLSIPISGYKHILMLVGIGQSKSTINGVQVYLDSVTGTAPVGPTNNVTTATVRGICYLHVGTRIYTVTWTGSGCTLTEITGTFTPGGILTNLIGICGSYNYLILLKSDNTVNWSSTTTPTDFTPSLVSGAGSGALVGTAGSAFILKESPFGFYVYCSGNVVSASYTGNARYPWKFVPIEDSEGVTLLSQVAGEPTDSFNVTVANSGNLMQVGQRGAQLIAQEISELISRLGYRDTFNYTTNEFAVESLTDPRFSLAYLMSRYIVLSVGGIGYVYDMLFKRYGKVNVNHNYVVDLNSLSALGSRTLVFIDLLSGTTKILSTNVNDSSVQMQGVLLLGKFQYVRARLIVLDEVSVESTQISQLVGAESKNFELLLLPTLDGKTFLPAVTPYLADEGDSVRTYNAMAEGKNISLLFKGAFDLCSVEMLLHLGGSV